jgi:predicted nucleic acid-binding Zn ribbon protein
LTQRACPSCKRILEGEHKFCPFCGVPLPQHEEPAQNGRPSTTDTASLPKTVPCLLCGKDIPATNDFCSYCGAEKYKSKQQRSNFPQTIPCAQCKTPNPPGTKYCLQCGEPIGLTGVEKLLQGKKFTGFEIPLTALAVPLLSASDAAVLNQIADHQGQGSSFPYRVENMGSTQFGVEVESFKSYRNALSNVLFPYNLPGLLATWLLVSIIYALWLTVLTSLRTDENPMVLVEFSSLVIGTFFPQVTEDSGTVLTFEKVLDSYIRGLPYSLLVAAILTAPTLILAVMVFRRNEALIEYRVNPISVGFSFGFSLLVPSVIQPGYPVAREQVPTRDLGYGYALGLLVTEGTTAILFLVVFGKVSDLYELGLPDGIVSQLSLVFVFAAWGCLFLTFPLANPLWKSVVEYNRGVYYIYLAMTFGFILFNWFFFSDIHQLIYEAAH